MTEELPRDVADVDRQTASIRRVDARCVVPWRVRRAAVLGDLDAWREGLELVGVEVTADGKPDLAVAPPGLLDEAVATGADAIAVEGGGARALARAGYHVTRYLPRPRIENPTFVLALAHGDAARYAALHATGSRSGWRAARNRVAASLLKRRLLPARASALTVGLRRPAPPLMIGAAGDLGVPRDAQWFMTLGRGDQLSRNVFHLFEPGAAAPSWVLKFVRSPGYRDPFDRDERGLRLAAASPVAAAHAPRLVGRFEADGLDASLETAARGELLARLLAGGASRSDQLRRIEEIARWIVDLGAATRADAAALEPERERLLRDVVAPWAKHGAGDDLVRSLPPIAAVLQHNDLGSWNILVDDRSFTAVDWESAREHGLPLWDLAYFLTDVLAPLDAPATERPEDRVVRLYRGEHPHSQRLFDWTAHAVEATAVPPDAVGRIVTLGWLHHGLSHFHRRAALEREQAVGYPSPPPLERLATVWLTTPGLGPGWDRWRTARTQTTTG
jgi:hypothetical protein